MRGTGGAQLIANGSLLAALEYAGLGQRAKRKRKYIGSSSDLTAWPVVSWLN